MKYQDKLKDPRWQRKRLEIFSRDNWSCLHCGDNTSPLHVHHLKYLGEPWEAPDEFLETVCEACHKAEHFKPIEVPVQESIKKDPELLFEHQLMDHTRQFQAIKHHYLSILHWIDSNGDTETLLNAKNDLSEYCYKTKVIFVALNGDVYGEKETVVRHG